MEIKIPKFKDPIDLILSQSFNGIIKQCAISKTPTNEYLFPFSGNNT